MDTAQLRAPLNVNDLRSDLLEPKGPLSRLEWVAEIGSTNSELAAEIDRNDALWPSLSLLGTEVQSGGKGRLGRSWQVPAGAGLSSSMVIRPNIPVSEYSWITMLSAVAVVRTLRSFGADAAIKWPNDVLAINPETGLARKICGILAQAVQTKSGLAVVLGVGLNISQNRDELPVETATSMALEGASSLDRQEILTQYVRDFCAELRRFELVGGNPLTKDDAAPSLVTQVSELMLTIGQTVRAELPNGTFVTGKAVGISSEGSLLITDDRGTTTTINAADVVHLRKSEPSGAIGYA